MTRDRSERLMRIFMFATHTEGSLPLGDEERIRETRSAVLITLDN